MMNKGLLASLKTASLLKEETQNADYQGQIFVVNGEMIRSRVAKKTPTKKGYFVVFWEKDQNQKNQPFSEKDECDYLLVKVNDGEKRGEFLFPKEVLVKEGILKSSKKPGKMAMRVYPSWEVDLNPTAKRTQQWQVPYFSETSKDN